MNDREPDYEVELDTLDALLICVAVLVPWVIGVVKIGNVIMGGW